MRYAARRKDQSQNPIVEALTAHGVIVFDVSGARGLGFDIVCYDRQQHRWQPAELKSDRTISHQAKARPRTPAQISANRRAPIPVWSTVAEAVGFFRDGRAS